MALANISPLRATVEVTICDESGLVTDLLPNAVDRPANGRTSFEFPTLVSQTAQRRGTVEFHTTTSGQISVLGLRFRASAFTTIPMLAK